MGNLQESAAAATEKTLKVLLYLVGRTPDDRLSWQPCETARSVLEVVAECTLVTRNWAEILARGESLSSEEYFRVFSGLDALSSREAIVDAVTAETSQLVSVIRAIPDEKLSDELQMFWGETALLGSWLHWVAIHNSYHLGQIGYIQRLYGDVED